VDGTGTEDQERDEEWMPACRNCGLPIRESQQPQARFGWTHTGDWEGVRCPGRVTGAVPDVRAAYRAGREDLLNSGSCPECQGASESPFDEPGRPHIHLTSYGYLLYAPDHEQLDFVRQIREIERRAGREDAARAGYAEAVARLREDDRYRNWWTAHPDQQFGTAYWAPDGRQHLADYLETVGPDGPDVRTKPVDQSGVQPTEEQRARDEDQKRDEEREHG
jgi:hypothetical protein